MDDDKDQELSTTRKSRDHREKEHHHKHRDSIKDRHHKHRTKDEREPEDEKHHRSSKDEKHRDSDHHRHRRSDREKRDRSREREGSRDRDRDRDSRGERSPRVRDESRSHKRKDRSGSAELIDGGDDDKRVRVSDREERRERRRVEDDDRDGLKKEEFEIAVEDDKNGVKEVRRGKRKFEDDVKEEQDMEGAEGSFKKPNLGEVKVKEEPKEEQVQSINGNHIISQGNGTAANGLAAEPFRLNSDHILPLPPNKVSSNTTTNENKGVNNNRIHEVPGKSSTDGASSSAAGNIGKLSLDAITKAKKALQKKKEIDEKLKKLPVLNRSANANVVIKSEPGQTVGVSASSGAGTSHTSSAMPASTSVMPPTVGLQNLTGASFEAVKRAQELAAKMGFRKDPEFAPLINLFPGQLPVDVAILPKPAKAPVLRLDALGREIDEEGNVVNITKPSSLSTLKVNINKQKKDAFQILKPELDVDPESNPFFDPNMGINKEKLLRPKRMTFQFVEEGKWTKDAKYLKLKSNFGEAQAKEVKAKQAQYQKAKAEPDINPNLIEVGERVFPRQKPKDPIPDVEWWDVPLLVSGTYGDIAETGVSEDKLKMEKLTIYVEHPRPIEPPAEPAPPPPQPLKLTKREQKKLRTQRRLAREKERQEMIRQGLLEPPKPKVKMSNLMKVLGSEATQDPTKLEMEIRSAAAEREQAHVDRNIARKLTPAERREKKERKLFDDPNTLETIVSVYKVNDLSHPQNRFKVEVNAKENRLTGCTVITEEMSVVVVEGGNKSITRYGKLILKRINWAASVENEDDEDDNEKPINKCVLVWQGSVAKPSFNRFSVHKCITDAAARKVFSDAGVAHYWDLSINYSDEDQL